MRESISNRKTQGSNPKKTKMTSDLSFKERNLEISLMKSQNILTEDFFNDEDKWGISSPKDPFTVSGLTKGQEPQAQTPNEAQRSLFLSRMNSEVQEGSPIVACKKGRPLNEETKGKNGEISKNSSKVSLKSAFSESPLFCRNRKRGKSVGELISQPFSKEISESLNHLLPSGAIPNLFHQQSTKDDFTTKSSFLNISTSFLAKSQIKPKKRNIIQHLPYLPHTRDPKSSSKEASPLEKKGYQSIFSRINESRRNYNRRLHQKETEYSRSQANKNFEENKSTQRAQNMLRSPEKRKKSQKSLIDNFRRPNSRAGSTVSIEGKRSRIGTLDQMVNSPPRSETSPINQIFFKEAEGNRKKQKSEWIIYNTDSPYEKENENFDERGPNNFQDGFYSVNKEKRTAGSQKRLSKSKEQRVSVENRQKNQIRSSLALFDSISSQIRREVLKQGGKPKQVNQFHLQMERLMSCMVGVSKELKKINDSTNKIEY